MRPLSDVSFELNATQSETERAPVVVELASPREIPEPEIERPLAVPETNPILLLNAFQSATESAPVVVEFAILILKSPVPELYVSGPFAEREVSPILVATTPERVFRFPERVAIFPVAVARFCWRVRMFPVAVARSVRIPRMFPVAVAILVSWRVLVPWSFWRAERRESADVTVPDHATNPVRTEVRLSFPENAR